MWVGGVRAIILDDEDRVLMVKQRHEGRDIWMMPGGAIEDGESAAEATAREVREETGIDVEVGRLIWHVEEVSERGQRFVNFFLCRISGGEVGLGRDPEFDDDHQVLKEVGFMSRKDMQEVEHIYPEYLKDELWEILEQRGDRYDDRHDPFKMRWDRR